MHRKKNDKPFATNKRLQTSSERASPTCLYCPSNVFVSPPHRCCIASRRFPHPFCVATSCPPLLYHPTLLYHRLISTPPALPNVNASGCLRHPPHRVCIGIQRVRVGCPPVPHRLPRLPLFRNLPHRKLFLPNGFVSPPHRVCVDPNGFVSPPHRVCVATPTVLCPPTGSRRSGNPTVLCCHPQRCCVATPTFDFCIRRRVRIGPTTKRFCVATNFQLTNGPVPAPPDLNPFASTTTAPGPITQREEEIRKTTRTENHQKTDPPTRARSARAPTQPTT